MARTPLLIASRAAPKPPRKPRYTTRDMPRDQKLYQPGEKGYHGPFAYETPKFNVQQYDDATAVANQLDINRRRQEKNQRKANRYAATAAIAPGALYLGMIPPTRRAQRRQAAENRAKAQRLSKGIGSFRMSMGGFYPKDPGGGKDWGKVGGLFTTENPGIRGPRKQGKVHMVTEAKPRQTRARRIYNRGGKFVMDHPSGLTGLAVGSLGAGTVGLLAGTRDTSRDLNASATELRSARAKAAARRRQLKATGNVSKSRGGAAYLRGIKRQAKDAVKDPKTTVSTLRRKPLLVATGGVGTAAVASGPATKNRGEETRRRRDTAARATYGAIGGQALYQGAMYGSKAVEQSKMRPIYKDPDNRRGYKDPRHKKILEAHKKKHGITDPNRKSDYKNFSRTFPTEIPGGRHHRINAQLTTGRRGVAVGTGVTLGGALLAGMGGRGKKEPVHKAVYRREEKTSPMRVAGLALGGALAAYGLGSSRMVGSAIARGVKMAQRGNYDGVAEALRRAEAARGSLRAGMAPGEAAVRRVRALNSAIERVPRSVRPEVALVAGTMLVNNSTPVTRTSYRPVSYPLYR